MAVLGLKAYLASVTVLATELNSLANNNVCGATTTGTGVVLDNTTNLSLYADMELIVTHAAAPAVGTTYGLYMSTSLDGTNYEAVLAAGTTLPQSGSAKNLGNFVVQISQTAQRIHLWRVPLTPGKHKFQLVNASGQAFPASGSTLVAYPYSMQVV